MRISYGDGAFWVVAPHDDIVIRVDPSARTVERHVIPEEPYDAAVGAGTVWIPRHDGFDVIGFRHDSVRRSTRLGSPQLAVGYGFRAVWTVGADGVLRRLEPRTLHVTGTVQGVADSNEGFEPKVAVAPTALWISDAVRQVVTKVEPYRLRVAATATHGGNGVAVAAGTVWSTDGSFAWRVSGGRPLRLKTGNGPVDVAAGGGAVWVANRFSNTIVRIDPRRGTITKTIHIAGRAAALAYGADYIGVALL
jgi:streptogramin lyase